MEGLCYSHERRYHHPARLSRLLEITLIQRVASPLNLRHSFLTRMSGEEQTEEAITALIANEAAEEGELTTNLSTSIAYFWESFDYTLTPRSMFCSERICSSYGGSVLTAQIDVNFA
jgi:hypothetical protein